MAKEPHSLTDVVESVEELGENNDEVCLGDALDEFGRRSFAPLLVVLPLVELSPVGGIPGLPTVLAVIVALVAAQLMFGRDHVWLPGFIEKRAIDGDKLAKATHKLDGVAETVDKHLGDRLDWMVEGIWPRIAAALVIVLCASVPPLEVIPFASSVPMLAVAAIGLSLLVRDGLLMLFAFLAGGGSIAFALYNLLSGSGGG